MEYQELVIKKINAFELKDIFDCGQCFRWNQTGNKWTGYLNDKFCEVWMEENILNIKTEETITEYEAKQYFAITDEDNKRYDQVYNAMKDDEILAEIVQTGFGLRVLRQPYWEMVVSYIISANNNIPSIKKTIAKMCEYWGNGKIPSPEIVNSLDIETLKESKCGFRAKYLKSAAENYLNGTINNLDDLDLEEVDRRLQLVSGIGPKVAACIELFSLNFTQICPVDVWIGRQLDKLYPHMTHKEAIQHINNKTQNSAGIIQEWMYYHALFGNKDN